MNVKSKLSSIELMRIFSMVLIVFSHCLYYGNFNFSDTEISLNRVIYQSSTFFGSLGNDIFMLISGYFLISNKEIKFKKILMLWASMVFYLLLFYSCAIFIGNTEFKLRSLVNCLMPISNKSYWFVNAYIIILLISPFLNKLIVNLSKRDYGILIIVMTIIWSLIPIVTLENFWYTPMLNFIYLYLVAGYIRVFKISFASNYWLIVSIAFFIFAIFSVYIIDYLSIFVNINFLKYYDHFLQMNSFPALIVSIISFVKFKNLKLESITINTISNCTFGVYLIHTNVYFVSYIWNSFFVISKYQDSKFLLIFSVCISIAVFLICSIVEFIKINSYNKIVEKLVNKFIKKKIIIK